MQQCTMHFPKMNYEILIMGGLNARSKTANTVV